MKPRKGKGGKCKHWAGSALALTVVMSLTACAHFSTTQTDASFTTNGTPLRTLTTKAAATTFWASSSELAKFKATQSDKTQGASVGSLSQASDVLNSNVMAGAGTILGQALKTMATPAK
jgi:predicted negative regulator of RcsB-dependent stress response